MSKELKIALQTPSVKDAWERNGSDAPDVSGADFGKMVSAEVVRWRKVVSEAGVKLD
jgi:tripartite-type tricarboxylate transporter receptor subunit TctC